MAVGYGCMLWLYEVTLFTIHFWEVLVATLGWHHTWYYGLHNTSDLVLSLLSLWFLLYQETIPLTNTLLRNQG